MGILATTNDLNRGSAVILAPHGDDEILGCGGWLLRSLTKQHRNTVVFVAQRDAQRRRESSKALAGLGVISVDLDLPEMTRWSRDSHREAVLRLDQVLRSTRPTFVFVPNLADPHPDHQGSHRLLGDAAALPDGWLQGFEGGRPDIEILQYEGMTPLAHANCLLDISEVMDDKLQRLSSYESQVGRYRLDEMTTHLNAYRARTLLRRQIFFAEAYVRLPLEVFCRCLQNRDS